MKLACSVILVTLFVAIESSSEDRVNRAKRGFRTGASDRFSHGFGKRDPTAQLNYEDYEKRLGFRHGASDRFSHGFGKRNEDKYATAPFSSEDMVEMLADNPIIRKAVYRYLLDRDFDGLVSDDELSNVRDAK